MLNQAALTKQAWEETAREGDGEGRRASAVAAGRESEYARTGEWVHTVHLSFPSLELLVKLKAIN